MAANSPPLPSSSSRSLEFHVANAPPFPSSSFATFISLSLCLLIALQLHLLRRRDAEAELNVPPGFRFHPTDEELVVHCLCRKAAGQRPPVPIIAEVDLYKYDPWDLPEMALFGLREWYFFTPRDRKYPNGSRPNRAAGSGYWKAAGVDKAVGPLAIKKALVFYHGKAPKGVKTDWIMQEYRLADTNRSPTKKGGLRLDDWVLCRLYNKKNSWENKTLLKQEAATETSPDNQQTPESDIEHEAFYSNLAAEKMKEDPGDWSMEFNLDNELQNPFAGIGAPPGYDVLRQDYYSPFLALPNVDSNHMNLQIYN